MDFKPAKKQFYVWVINIVIFGVVIFLAGFIPATLGKQYINLSAAGIKTVDNFMLFYLIIVATVFSVLTALIYLHYSSVNYSFLNDRVVTTMNFPAKKEKVIFYKDIIDVEEHQGLLEKPFGLMHLVMKTKSKQSFLDKLLWGWDTLPGIIIKEGILKELTSRVVKSS